MSQCPNCGNRIEPSTWHEALPDSQCRVKDEASNIPLYTSGKTGGKTGSGWGKE